MVDEPRAALPSGDWPLAGWLAGRRTLAGSIAARLLWQPALSSGHAGLAMLRPALRAFVPAICVAPLFEPVAGPLQRRETSWSEVDRFWWRRQAPELALLRRHSRWAITPVPVQREQAASAPTAGPPAEGLVREAPLDEAVALELEEEGPVTATLAHPAEPSVSTGTPAVGQQSQVPASQAGPLAAIGRAFAIVMRRLFPAMEHAPVAGSRRLQILPDTAGNEARPGPPVTPGADVEELSSPLPKAGPAQPAGLVGERTVAEQTAAAGAWSPAPAGPVLAAPLEQTAAGLPSIPSLEPPALAPAAAFRSSTGAGEELARTEDLSSGMSGEPASAARQTADAPSVARRAAAAGHAPGAEEEAEGTLVAAGLPETSRERSQRASGGGVATLRLRALELWHRVVPRRARPAGPSAALAVERAVEPAASVAGRADQGGGERASRAIEPAPTVEQRAIPAALAVAATTPVTGLHPTDPFTPDAQPGATIGTPGPADTGGAVEPPTPRGEVERSVEAPVSSDAPDLPEPQDRQRVSTMLTAPHKQPEPDIQLWRPGEPRPAPADLVAPLAAGVLQRRGAEASGESEPAPTGSEQVALPGISVPGWPPARTPGSSSAGVAPPAPAPTGTTPRELPPWAASLSEQLRRLQRSAPAEPATSLPHEGRPEAVPSPGQAMQRPAPAEPGQVQRAGDGGAPGPAVQVPEAGTMVPAVPPAVQEPAPGALPGSVGQGSAGAAGTGTSSTPVKLVGFPPLAAQLFARTQTFGARIVQRRLAMPLANAPGWAEEHAAAAGRLAAEVVSQVSALPAPGSAPLSGTGKTDGSGMAPGEAPRAPGTSGAALSSEPAGSVPAEPGADAAPVSPYAAYLEAVRASGMLPGAPSRPRFAAQSRRAAAGPFRLSEGGSEPDSRTGRFWPGAPAGIHRTAGPLQSGSSGTPLDIQGSAAGAAAGTQEPEPAPEGSAPDQDELAQVLRRLPPAMAAAALTKGVLAPLPGAPGRTATGAAETAPLWQPLTRVQAPAVVARAPDFVSAGVEETEAHHPFAGDWEAFETGSATSWETSAELLHALQRAAEPQPSEAPGAPGAAGEQGPTAPGPPQAAELDRLADEVFELLRWRLAAERERMMR